MGLVELLPQLLDLLLLLLLAGSLLLVLSTPGREGPRVILLIMRHTAQSRVLCLKLAHVPLAPILIAEAAPLGGSVALHRPRRPSLRRLRGSCRHGVFAACHVVKVSGLFPETLVALMARGFTSHRCCRCRSSSATATAAAAAATAAACAPKILEHLGLTRAELFYPGRAVYFLRVALLVSVVTALLPEGLHTVQQHGSGPTALLEMEEEREISDTHLLCTQKIKTG